MLHPGTEHPFLVGHSACFGVRLGFAAWHAAQPSGLSDRAVLVARTTCLCIEIAACYATRLPLPLLRQGCIIDRLLPHLHCTLLCRCCCCTAIISTLLLLLLLLRLPLFPPSLSESSKDLVTSIGEYSAKAASGSISPIIRWSRRRGVVYTWPIYSRCLLSFFAFSLLLNELSIRRSEGAGGAGVEHLVEREGHPYIFGRGRFCFSC